MSNATLAERLLAPHQRDAVITDCVKILERHLSGLRSLRGIALKGGLAVFKTAMPDVMTRVVRKLLPDIASALEPQYQQFQQSSDRDFSLFLRKHSGECLDALMETVDARVAASSNETVKSAYKKLRSSARAELEAIFPELAKTLSGYLG